MSAQVLSQLAEHADALCNETALLGYSLNEACSAIGKSRESTDALSAEIERVLPKMLVFSFAPLERQNRWRAKMQLDGNLFTERSRPKFLQDAVDRTDPLPELAMFDGIRVDKKSCLKDYSDPSFLRNYWIKKEIARQELLMKRKNERRKKKKRVRREQKVAMAEGVTRKVFRADGTVVLVNEYNQIVDEKGVVIGEFKDDAGAPSAAATKIAEEPLRKATVVTSPKAPQRKASVTKMPPAVPQKTSKSKTPTAPRKGTQKPPSIAPAKAMPSPTKPAEKPPPVPVSPTSEKPAEKPIEKPAEKPKPAERPPIPAKMAQIPPEITETPPETPRAPEPRTETPPPFEEPPEIPPAVEEAPEIPPAVEEAPEIPPAVEEAPEIPPADFEGEAAPPPVVAEGAPEPPEAFVAPPPLAPPPIAPIAPAAARPDAPAKAAGGGRTNLLDAIRTGKPLKKTERVETAKAEPEEDLTSSIFMVLQRRAAIVGSDSEDQSEGGDWDSD